MDRDTGKFDWPKKAVLQLIELYKTHECLYNSKHKFYHNKNARYSALNAMAEKLKVFYPYIGANDVKNKITYLRGQYTREVAKMREIKSEQGADDEYIPSAYWYEHISFLADFITPRKGCDLLSISGNKCTHPKYNSCWSKYPYDEVELEEFFMNSTFDEDETFQPYQYGLNGLKDNVEVTSSLHFYMGRCHTIRPKILLTRASRAAGYSMMLKHHVSKIDSISKTFEKPPGWHLFIHDSRENFTEINMKASGRVEYVFADINEEIEIKLQSQYFSNVESKQQSCSRLEGYSDLKCGEVCIWQDLAKTINCSGPWMYDIPEEPCSSYKSIMKLIAEYGKVYESDDDAECDCIQPCESRIFSTYIQNRKEFIYPEPNTQVWIYYTTKLISMMEERPSYDTTQFIADVGGSLGFLLGLSVLGLIGILEHLTLFLCGGVIRRMQHKHEKRLQANEELDKASETSSDTVDIATIYDEKL